MMTLVVVCYRLFSGIPVMVLCEPFLNDDNIAVPVLVPLVLEVGEQVIKSVHLSENKLFVKLFQNIMHPAAEKRFDSLATFRKFYAVNILQLVLLRAILIRRYLAVGIYRHSILRG